jgi:DNA ligase D-like protein (predicted ligase)
VRLLFVEPMAAIRVDTLPSGNEWLYEAKFDGYRALVMKEGRSVRILSRKGRTLTADYPQVLAAASELEAASAVIDGEVVAFDEDGRPSFQQLQHRSSPGMAIRFFAFDLLHLNGVDLKALTLEERRARLARLLKKSTIEFSQELQGSPDQVIHAVSEVGLEGVVAKRRDSRYEPGKRSPAWQKLKLQQRQEFVIGGYKPEGHVFQSLVVGYYVDRALRFAGRVRSGLTPAQRAALFERLKRLGTSKCPFIDLPTGKTSHWGEGVTEEDMKKLKWVRPRMVAEIAFTEWTRDGHLRHSRFVGLRDDKDPKEVVREESRA